MIKWIQAHVFIGISISTVLVWLLADYADWFWMLVVTLFWVVLLPVNWLTSSAIAGSMAALYLLRVFTAAITPIQGVYNPHWLAVLPDEFGHQWRIYEIIPVYVVIFWAVKATYTVIKRARTR